MKLPNYKICVPISETLSTPAYQVRNIIVHQRGYKCGRKLMVVAVLHPSRMEKIYRKYLV